MSLNPFWIWRRLREGRQVFKATTELKHRDGTVVTVTVEGAHAEYVSAVMNGIKAKYKPSEAPVPAVGSSAKDTEDPWKAFDDFLRRERTNST